MEDSTRRSIVATAALFMTALAQFGCRAGHPGLAANERLIRQSDDPKEWPFNVSEGVLSCGGSPKSPGLPAVTFHGEWNHLWHQRRGFDWRCIPLGRPSYARTAVGLYEGNYGKYLDDGLYLCKARPCSVG